MTLTPAQQRAGGWIVARKARPSRRGAQQPEPHVAGWG